MPFGGAADHVLQQAQSAHRARLSQPGDKLWARVGDAEGFVRVSPISDHIYVHYMGSTPFLDGSIPGPLMIARNFTGHEYVAGDIVPVEWMDDGMASILRITARASISYRRVTLNAIAHVGGIDDGDPRTFENAEITIQPDTLASGYALQIPPAPYQGVCGHPTEYRSYFTICIWRGQVIEVKGGKARPVAGVEALSEAAAGSPPDQVGVAAFSGGGGSVAIRPRGIVADEDGNLFVLCLPPTSGDYTSDLIGTFQVDGTWSWVFGNSTTDGYSGDGGACEDATGGVTQMAIGGDGSLYLTDNVNKVVRKISGPVTPASTITRIAGHDPITPPAPPTPPISNPLLKYLYNPIAIAVSGSDVYVGDSPAIYRISGGSISVYGGPIQMLTGDSVPVLSAPPSYPGLTLDRLATRFDPFSMAMGVDGALYVLHGGTWVGYSPQRYLVVIHSQSHETIALRNQVEWHAGHYDGHTQPIPSSLMANMGPHMSQSRYPYPQAPINEANSLSFDLAGDLYFTDSQRKVVRKMIDDDYWVAANHGGSLMVFRPDASYMEEAPVGGAGVVPFDVAELDGSKKLVGLRREYNSGGGFDSDYYYAHVLNYSEAVPLGYYSQVGSTPLQGWGGLGVPHSEDFGAPDVYYAFQIFFCFMCGSLMAFVRASAGSMQVYRLVAQQPPPNELSLYSWELYHAFSISENDEWRHVSSSGTYASVAYINIGRHEHIRVSGLPGEPLETRLYTKERMQMYDGVNLYDADYWQAMGIGEQSDDDSYTIVSGTVSHHMVTVASWSEQQAFSFYERVRPSHPPNTYFLTTGVSFPRWDVIAGQAWRASGGYVPTFGGAVPPSGGIYTFGEGQNGETYSTIELFNAFGPTELSDRTYFVLVHNPFDDSGAGGPGHGKAIGSQYFLFPVSGNPSYIMPLGFWVGTARSELIHLVATTSAQSPAHIGKFTLPNESTRFTNSIGG